MSIDILHYSRNPKPYEVAVAEFALEKGLQLRYIGHYAKVLVYEWQVDLLDHLPLYLLRCRHIVVAHDLADELIEAIARITTRKQGTYLRLRRILM